MKKIGITGGIGSGKTYVCDVFRTLGVPIYNADFEARNILNSNPFVISEVTRLFGNSIYIEGIADRKKIASLVFSDKEKLTKLNSIIHPCVQQDFEQWIDRQKDVKYVIKEAAIMLESGYSQLLDKIVLVYAPKDIRIARVINRDSFTEKQVLERMSNQMDEEEKLKKADEVIYNDNKQLILPQILKLHSNFSN